MANNVIRLLLATLFTAASASASAEIVFSCADPSGCQLQVPTAHRDTGDLGTSAYTVSLNGSGFTAQRSDSDWTLGGTWEASFDAVNDNLIFRMLGSPGFGEITVGLNYYGELSGRDFGTWGPPSVSSVPEPGTLAVLGLGLAGLAFTRRRWR